MRPSDAAQARAGKLVVKTGRVKPTNSGFMPVDPMSPPNEFNKPRRRRRKRML
jgi:hypothetical protein